MRRGICLVVILAALGGCAPQSPFEPIVGERQMPPQDPAQARIIIYRHDGPTQTWTRPKDPVVAIDDDASQVIADDTLIIRDLPPGPHRISVGLQDSSTISRSQTTTVQAGDEWYVQVMHYPVNCSSAPRVKPYNETLAMGDSSYAVSAGAALLAWLVIDRMREGCDTVLRADAVWPSNGRERINLLLAKNGAPQLPAMHNPISNMAKTGMSWPQVEDVLRQHFDANAGAYLAVAGRPPQQARLRYLSMRSEIPGDTPGTVIVVVTLSYYAMDDATRTGRLLTRNFRYTLTRDGDTLAVAGWQVVDP